ncbi:unnamed protein product [marine sediment metagenome]|uniref:Uncharacterized protein n=1 Tax=marine sediment metagenome TaxID=412755 RepID=X0T259_9ZZZZ
MTKTEKLNIAQCYNHHDGKWPKENDASGVQFWNGQRIVKADFRAMKRDGLESSRFK